VLSPSCRPPGISLAHREGVVTLGLFNKEVSMKANTCLVLIILSTLLGILFVFGGSAGAMPVVDVNVNIGAPPPFVLAAPPAVAVIPGTYVYMVPGIAVDILFYHGYWYRPYQGHWHRAQSYNGPWVAVEPHRVPAALVELPPDYRRIPPGHQHIPYGQLKKNWGKWERERHWAQGGGSRDGYHERAESTADARGHEGRGFDDRKRGHEEYDGHGRGR